MVEGEQEEEGDARWVERRWMSLRRRGWVEGTRGSCKGSKRGMEFSDGLEKEEEVRAEEGEREGGWKEGKKVKRERDDDGGRRSGFGIGTRDGC